jgi:hypothetical protein
VHGELEVFAFVGVVNYHHHQQDDDKLDEGQERGVHIHNQKKLSTCVAFS